ncbi:uncharacterized protein [Typha angustifolia]|uniref:uncharacterized protein n=1 Tax=Typha angustifolia TaxID=59011 RepID=UPI003C2D15FD
MCRSTTNNADFPSYTRDRDRLKIRAFYLRLIEQQDARRPLPENLTLVFLPRIDGIGLEINGSKTRPGAAAIVALDRVRSPGPGSVFASTDRVRIGEGARFEAYLRDEVVVTGVFRRNSGGGGWRMECRCANPEEAAASEVWVVAENGVCRSGNFLVEDLPSI